MKPNSEPEIHIILSHVVARREARNHYVGPGFFAPVCEYWKNTVREVRPDLYSAYNHCDRIMDDESVMKLMRDGGAFCIEVEAEEGV